jgi:D-alanyl-D-alanine carboxypeptidase (penicillin-binding protein 5/6)
LLLDIFPQDGVKIVGGKTGYTSTAGSCFVGQFTNEGGKEIISVVLGGADINSRFEETKRLVNWTYDNYLW